MRTELYPHNLTAYHKVMAAFKTSDRTCVVHPTGTGKSYIVAAVAEHFKQVLILAPGNFILHQQRDVMDGWPEGVDFATYKGLTDNFVGIAGGKKYDLIVLDEFHRAGAPEWGAAVELLLENQPQAKKLGTSATPIRYLDGERDMSDELFDGHVASEMSIAEAWTVYKVLPIPTYVSGLFRWDLVADDAEDRIRRSRKLNAEEKRKRIFRLKNKRMNWELSYGMPAILSKHLVKDARRVIVFCGNIEIMMKMRQEVSGWFCEAGFTLAGTYTLHSKLSYREQHEQMRGFEADNDTGVKLMFSVDMLNEGIHVPNVSAVLMLRTTSSPIIYMQQMGRCLTAANTAHPLVLDMVDNITTTSAISDFKEEFDRLELIQSERDGRKPRHFEVIDYILDVRQVVEKLAPFRKAPQEVTFLSKEQRLAIVVPFSDKNKRLPNRAMEPEIYKHWNWLLKNARDDEEVLRLSKTYSKRNSFELRLKDFTDFYDSHNRYPRRANGKEEESLEAFWKSARKHHHDNPTVKAYVEKERQRREREAKEEIERLVAACYEMKRSGKSLATTSEYKKLMSRYPNHPSVVELCKKCVMQKKTRLSLEERLDKYEALMKEKGRRIIITDGKDIYTRWKMDCMNHADHPRIKYLLANYKPHDRVEARTLKTCADVRAFWEQNGRAPLAKDGNIYNRFSTQTSFHRDHPEVQKLIHLMNYAPDKNHTIYEDAMAFYRQHGRMPSSVRDRRLYCRITLLIRRHPELPEAQELKRLKELSK